MERILRVQTLVIAESASASDAWLIDDTSYGSILLPAALTGTALAIQGRFIDSGSWFPILDPLGAALSVAFAASSIIRIPDAAFACRELQLVSNGTEAAARSIGALSKS